MPISNLKEFLDNQGVDYEIILHRARDTAQGTAAASGIPASKLAKTVIAKIDGAMNMVVVPACERVDLQLLKAVTGASTVALASEGEFLACFPNCEAGAMPAFGNLYGLPVVVDESVAANPQIVFNAGSHSELVRLAYADFERLVAPRVMPVATRPALAKAA